MKRCLVALFLLLLSVSLTFADQTLGVRAGQGGVLEARTLTAADGLARWPATEAQSSPRPMTGNDILWIDTNSQNAIAENVAISGDGTYGIAGWWLNNKRVANYSLSQGNVPVWTHPMLAAFQIPVDADNPAQSMVATGRGDSLYDFASASAHPVHRSWYTPPLVGYKCAVSANGNTYAGAGGNPDGSAGEFRVYDGSGVLRFLRSLPVPPEGAAVSADGLVAAATVRTFVKVWDAMTGALRDSVSIPQGTQTGSVLSGDGSYLATAGLSNTVRLYQWNGSRYALAWSYNISATTWVTALAISGNGLILVAGTWTNPTGGDVVVFSTASSTPLWTDSSYGDEVESVATSWNGTQIVAADWGRSGGTVGNIISIYDVSSATPIFGVADDQIPGVGSAMGIDIDANGEFILAGGKAVHAREYGYGGWAMGLYTQIVSGDGIPKTSGPMATLSARPNPSAGPVRLLLNRAAVDVSREILIVGADGRSVRRGALVPSVGSWLWDGRDSFGRKVPPGAYFARILASGGVDRTGNGVTIIRSN